jgi:hypothetical protein
MRLTCKTLLCSLFAVMPWPMSAQDLAPRAYVITPVHSNVVNLTWSFYNGGVNFNGAVPITGATGTFSVPIFTLYHSFGFFGRSANFAVRCHMGLGTSKVSCCNSIVRFIGPG